MLDSIFKTILDMTLSSSFLIVAVLIARIILRKSPKVFRKILWGLVALKLIIPFSFESALSLVPHESTYMPEGTGASATITDVVTSSAFDWKSIIPCVWVGGCAILLIYAFFSFIRLKIRISDSVKYENNIFQSEKVESPFVFGVVKPKIYIPYNIAGEKLSFVLEHEKTHIKHLDHITKILGFIVLCVHWFNPLVWVSYVLFCKDLEFACDEAVVKNMNESKRKCYARTLCDIGVNKAKISACPITFGEVSIKERVKATISYKKVGKIAISLSMCLSAVVAVCFMTKPVAEAKEKTESSVTEEITVPATEPVTEPVTEPITEPTTEFVTEETTTETTYVEVYYENDSGYKNSLDDPEIQAKLKQQEEEIRLQMEMWDRKQQREFEQRQYIAQAQNSHYTNPYMPDVEIRPTYYGGASNPPSPNVNGFGNNNWVGSSNY